MINVSLLSFLRRNGVLWLVGDMLSGIIVVVLIYSWLEKIWGIITFHSRRERIWNTIKAVYPNTYTLVHGDTCAVLWDGWPAYLNKTQSVLIGNKCVAYFCSLTSCQDAR